MIQSLAAGAVRAPQPLAPALADEDAPANETTKAREPPGLYLQMQRICVTGVEYSGGSDAVADGIINKLTRINRLAAAGDRWGRGGGSEVGRGRTP
jgi:hypothetical protein